MSKFKMPLIVAHRGASYAAPENTMPSFRLAFDEGADFIEGDFWLSEDNRIVCIHDKNTKRTAPEQINLNVTKSTLGEIEKLDFGNWKNIKYKKTRIVSLDELLSAIPEGKGIFIEIKDSRKSFLDELKNVLAKSRFPHRLIRIIAFDPQVIMNTKKNFPDIKSYWLFEWLLKDDCENFKSVLSKLFSTLDSIGADGIDMNYSNKISGEIVGKVKNLNYDFVLYDINKNEDALRMANAGVDAITTNYPKKIKTFLEGKSINR